MTDAPAATVDLDEFRLVRVIGQGGMGSVYLGYDTVLERDVAIKLLRERAADDDARLRFLTEARAIARLDHPNVIAIFRASTTRAGHPYLVQELVRGQSLDRLALPVAPERALAIGLGLARGLAAAHRRGILHRDVKPANVMIDDDGTPKLLDFGVAKLTRRDQPGPAGPARPGSAGELEHTLEAAAPRSRDRDLAELATAGLSNGKRPQPLQPPTAPGAVAETIDHLPGHLPGHLPEHMPGHMTGHVPGHLPAPLPGPGHGPVPELARTDAATAPAGPGDPETETGAIIGTPRYMAPEIWCGEPATARSDLYSFGALLYELATGTPPHAQADRATLEAAVVDGPPPRPVLDGAPGLDAALAEIIMACLARDPARRPESADEIAHRIDRIVVGAPPVPDGNPYPGLAPFADEHRAVFYGRGTDISTVVDRLRSAPLVVVAGDSGIGKSSLCRAGVLPAIERGGLGDRRAWRVRTILIGRHAAAALRDALALAGTATDLSHSEVARASGASNDAGLVIFLDQFEELVTLNDPGEAAEAATIIASLARGVAGVKILIAVRGDFLTRVAALPELGTLMTRSLHLLRVLSPADARDAVAGPARAKGVRFETAALIETLASSIAGQPGALPLLSFALAELWQRRDVAGAVIPAAALDAIGGVSGGLARHADAVIGALGGPERIAARRIALLLVTHDDTRGERDRRELCPDGDPAAGAALEAMIHGRLVVARHTASGEPIYELAHDSLIAAWSMLRGWRDDVAGQRGLRTRLAAAADDWRRLGRRRDALWNRAQLAEAAKLDELSDGDRGFLTASRAAVRRRRFGAVALAASLPAVAIATWLAIAGQSRAARDREVATHAAAAAHQLDEARAARSAALRDRAAAFERFDAYDMAAAEPVWARALSELTAARTIFASAARELEVALLIDGARDDVRAGLTRTIFDQAVLAELAYDDGATRELTSRLDAFDDRGTLASVWHAPATLSIDAPGAARIDVRAYHDRDGRRELGAPVAAATAHQLTAALAPGSYLIELRGGDGVVVRDPVVAAHGEQLRLAIPLPRAADVPGRADGHAGMVYVPPGRFLVGGGPGWEATRPTFLATSPLHAVTTGGYLIAITEVTFGDWMTYLRALPEAERERRRPGAAALGPATLRLDGGRRPDEPFVLTIQPTTRALVAREGQPLVYPGRTRRRAIRWEAAPVSWISLEDARAYTGWLAATGRVPGARVCSDREWERAARGADGRTWAHGDRLEPDDANFDETYGRNDLAYGPDEVGVHPASASPFGLLDTVGNTWELTETPDGQAALRGGGWDHTAASATVANRDLHTTTDRSMWSGLRICATPR